MSRTVILIVDDNPHDRERLRRILLRRVQGCQVYEAADGAAALALLAGRRVDVVITDHHVGPLSGIQLLEAVHHQHPTTRRLIFTAEPGLHLLESALSRGRVQGYLLKHWSTQRLSEAIEHTLAPK